jgi:signal transduction histidine kinase
MLGSLTLKLDLADEMIDSEPDTARKLIRSLKTEAQAAVTDIRRLVYALRPPALDDLGLIGAVRETAAQCGMGGLRVTVQVPDMLPPLPAAVEVAAYRIIQESLTNTVRHAGASDCTVRITLRDDGLVIEVTDDGCGFADSVHRGVGIASMCERAAEIGGECIVEPLNPGGAGTRVRAVLPGHGLGG